MTKWLKGLGEKSREPVNTKKVIPRGVLARPNGSVARQKEGKQTDEIPVLGSREDGSLTQWQSQHVTRLPQCRPSARLPPFPSRGPTIKATQHSWTFDSELPSQRYHSLEEITFIKGSSAL